MKTRQHILMQAAEVISGPREQDYGKPEENFLRIANLWQAYLPNEDGVMTYEVAVAMALLKIARLQHDPTHWDSWVDACGYLALAAELAGLTPLTNDEVNDDERLSETLVLGSGHVAGGLRSIGDGPS